MLQHINNFLKNLDESQLPDSRIHFNNWTHSQYMLVSKLREYHQFLWYFDRPNKQVIALLSQLDKYCDCDGGYIYMPTTDSTSK